MYIFDLLFYFIFVICISISVIAYIKKKRNTLLLVLHTIPIITSLIHLIICGLNYIAVPLYAASIIILLMYTVQKKKPLFFTFIFIVIVLVSIPVFLRSSGMVAENYSSMNYAKAFTSLNNFISERYPFSQLKKIDFQGKYRQYIKRFEEADEKNSKAEYYIALRDYIRSFPDSHLSVLNASEVLLGKRDTIASNLRAEYIGSSYGLTVLELEDGKVVTNIVRKGSEADKAGIKIGSEITAWNGKTAKEAAENVSLLWNSMNAASKDTIKRFKYSLLARGKEGQKVSVRFIDDTGIEKTVSLNAEKDNFDLLSKDLNVYYRSKGKKNLNSRIIDGNHGYICLTDMPEDSNGEYRKIFKDKLLEFKNKGVRDLIIDARSNQGGMDEFGASILGLLTKKEIFYTQECEFDCKTKTYKEVGKIIAKPDNAGFDKSIVILVNNLTVSAGEGFAYNARKLSNVKIAGISGTNGSFGTITGGILMPGNYFIGYPQLACMDEKGQIMIDTDYNNIGGVQPDIKIPLDINALNELYNKEKDYELDYVLNYLLNNKSLGN